MPDLFQRHFQNELDHHSLQESKEALAGEISDAVHVLMNAVKTFDEVYVREDEEEEEEEEEESLEEKEKEKEETENMAANIVEVCACSL